MEGLLGLKIESWSQPVQSNKLTSIQFSWIQFSSVQCNSVRFSSIIHQDQHILTHSAHRQALAAFPTTLHKPRRSPPRFSVFSPSGGPRPAMANVNVNALKTGVFHKAFKSSQMVYQPCVYQLWKWKVKVEKGTSSLEMNKLLFHCWWVQGYHQLRPINDETHPNIWGTARQ